MDSSLDYLIPEPTVLQTPSCIWHVQTHSLICSFLYYQVWVTTPALEFPSDNYADYYKVPPLPPITTPSHWLPTPPLQSLPHVLEGLKISHCSSVLLQRISGIDYREFKLRPKKQMKVLPTPDAHGGESSKLWKLVRYGLWSELFVKCATLTKSLHQSEPPFLHLPQRIWTSQT